MKTSLKSVLCASVLLCGSSLAALADATITVNNPRVGSDRLDWCRDWATDCGQGAADAFCQSRGYTSATAFEMDADIGATTRTRLIGTGAVCDQAFCDGFKYITCLRPSEVFNNPQYNGNRLDWCRDWATDCGQGAADAFCQWKGYAQASDFEMAPDIGAAHPTRLIGTGAVCDQAFCDGFARIECTN